jgi:hypothetical protein
MKATIEDGGPAVEIPPGKGNDPKEQQPRMSLRDYFAAAALQGIIAYPGMEPDDASKEGCAQLAYQFADAMLQTRKAVSA